MATVIIIISNLYKNLYQKLFFPLSNSLRFFFVLMMNRLSMKSLILKELRTTPWDQKFLWSCLVATAAVWIDKQVLYWVDRFFSTNQNNTINNENCIFEQLFVCMFDIGVFSEDLDLCLYLISRGCSLFFFFFLLKFFFNDWF